MDGLIAFFSSRGRGTALRSLLVAIMGALIAVVNGRALVSAATPRPDVVSRLDWMTMACLSASTCPMFVRRLPAPRPDDQLGSVTFPWVLKHWFAATGSRPVIAGGRRAAHHQQRHLVMVSPQRQPAAHPPAPQPDKPEELGALVPRFFRAKAPDEAADAIEGIALADWSMDLSLVAWDEEAHAIKLRRLGDVAERLSGVYSLPRIH